MKNNMDWSALPVLLIILAMLGMLYVFYLFTYGAEEKELPELTVTPIEVVDKVGSPLVTEELSPVVELPKEPILSDEDIMAIVAMCEAGNQELIGKVAVVSTILNRCDYYGETVETVVYKPNQYSFDKDTVPNEDCYLAVKIALRERDLFPSTMMWFLPNDWSPYGDHYLKIQDHYFSYLKEE